jgi:hypothetical protein
LEFSSYAFRILATSETLSVSRLWRRNSAVLALDPRSQHQVGGSGIYAWRLTRQFAGLFRRYLHAYDQGSRSAPGRFGISVDWFARFDAPANFSTRCLIARKDAPCIRSPLSLVRFDFAQLLQDGFGIVLMHAEFGDRARRAELHAWVLPCVEQGLKRLHRRAVKARIRLMPT